MDENLKVLVVSDLHATTKESESKDSKLIFQNDISEFGEGIIDFIKSTNEKIDILICAGDIANKADIKSFEKGWSFLNKLKYELKIPHFLCVPGNHDHASRNADFSPKHHLQFIDPPFPLDCHAKNTHFWAWNWTDIEFEHFNSVLINTSAYHGYGDQYKHGRIATEVSDQIYNKINSPSFNKKTFNLLLCHHHPIKMESVDKASDGEVIDGAEYLLNKLQSVDKGPWLIVHGHKHFAEITIGASTNGSPPTILSAGSVSAMLYSEIEDRTSNQMYVLDIDLSKTMDEDKLVGTFIAYEYAMGFGWRHSESPNLPAKGGFGSIHSPQNVLTKVKGMLGDAGSFLSEEDLAPVFEMIKYFTPGEFTKLLQKLRDNNFEVQWELNQIVEIGVANAK